MTNKIQTIHNAAYDELTNYRAMSLTPGQSCLSSTHS